MTKNTALLLTFAFIFLVTLLIITTTLQTNQDPPLFGKLKLREQTYSCQQERLTNKKERSLRYCTPIKRNNPFLALYQQKTPTNTPTERHKKTQIIQSAQFFQVLCSMNQCDINWCKIQELCTIKTQNNIIVINNLLRSVYTCAAHQTQKSNKMFSP